MSLAIAADVARRAPFRTRVWRGLVIGAWVRLVLAGWIVPAAHGAESSATQELPGSAVSLGAPANAGSPWGDFVESEFPFFSSVLDARAARNGLPTNNLSPRTLILNLGHGCWVGFDPDLLRVASVWHGNAVTPVSMAQGSYHLAGTKAPEGQDRLPTPDGLVWVANGIYPGWQEGEVLSRADPRDPGPDPREVGRGALAPELGRFGAIRLVSGTPHLEYEVRGARIDEQWSASLEGGDPVVERSVRIASLREPVEMVIGYAARSDTNGSGTGSGGRRGTGIGSTITLLPRLGSPVPELHVEPDGLRVVRVVPGGEEGLVEFSVVISGARAIGDATVRPAPPERPAASRAGNLRWPETVVTHVALAPATNAYVVDLVPLPLGNPWRRNLRFADLAFVNDQGHAMAVTFDGDVWSITGLRGDLTQVVWRRFASGLHEPLGIVAAPDGIYVHDRNGIWRLRDTDGNGEADLHEMFCNVFAQTAETREFAVGLRRAPDGSFVIAKGGQEGTTIGRHNGTVLRIALDGRSVTVLGHGFRQPFLGVHPRTGLVTVSDQQGHYVPATPLHFLAGDAFHGFVPLILPHDRYPEPITEPLLWIPHPINASGAGQVWLTDARMGPLNDMLVHVGYYRPEAFVVLGDGDGGGDGSGDGNGMAEAGRSPRQAAVVSLTRGLDFSPLAGAVNPADGQLYLTGFQIWGTVAPQISGLARVRYTGRPHVLPVGLTPTAEGIWLRFAVALEPSVATNLANYSLERWGYRRSSEYGSPHFRLDGSKGQETVWPSSVYLARDGRSVFLGIPGMRPVMQMRLGWALATRAGQTFGENAYFTPNELGKFDPVGAGFVPVVVDLTVRPRSGDLAAADHPAPPSTPAEGKRLSELMGCVACHSTDGSVLGKVGPSWKGILGQARTFADGGTTTANEAYLYESIREPSKRVVRGFEKSDTGMPSYEGVLTDPQIDALVAYLKSL